MNLPMPSNPCLLPDGASGSRSEVCGCSVEHRTSTRKPALSAKGKRGIAFHLFLVWLLVAGGRTMCMAADADPKAPQAPAGLRIGFFGYWSGETAAVVKAAGGANDRFVPAAMGSASALPFRTTGSLRPAFAPARLVSLAVKQPYAIALLVRFPTVPRLPSHSSVTLWEETAPVKLPTIHGPQPRFGV